MIYKQFECSAKIPGGFIMPVNPEKMRSIDSIEQLKQEVSQPDNILLHFLSSDVRGYVLCFEE